MKCRMESVLSLSHLLFSNTYHCPLELFLDVVYKKSSQHMRYITRATSVANPVNDNSIDSLHHSLCHSEYFSIESFFAYHANVFTVKVLCMKLSVFLENPFLYKKEQVS